MTLTKMLLTWRSTVFSLRKSSRGDHLVGLARGDQAQHLELARRQTVRRSRGRRRSGASRAARSGAAPSVRRPRAPVELQRAPSRRRARGTRARSARGAAPRCTARRPVPDAERAPQRLDRRRGVALGERDRAPRVRRHRAEHLGAEVAGDLLELARSARASSTRRRPARSRRAPAGGACGGAVARRGSAPRIALTASASALREAQQREPGLRLAAALAGAAYAASASAARRAGDGSRPAGRASAVACGRPCATPAFDARRASSIASGHAPPSCSISARWTRHAPPNVTSCGCASHQPDSAAVHSRARSSACTAGGSSRSRCSRPAPSRPARGRPSSRATIASSSSARPALDLPLPQQHPPLEATRERGQIVSRKRSPRPAASAAAARAPS